MSEKLKGALNNKGFCGTVLTDLSKAFAILNHKLLTAKLKAYGCDYLFNKIYSYLTKRN